MRVIPSALVRVAQGLVRRADLLESLLRLVQPALVLVGMPLQRQLAVRLEVR